MSVCVQKRGWLVRTFVIVIINVIFNVQEIVEEVNQAVIPEMEHQVGCIQRECLPVLLVNKVEPYED